MNGRSPRSRALRAGGPAAAWLLLALLLLAPLSPALAQSGSDDTGDDDEDRASLSLETSQDVFWRGEDVLVFVASDEDRWVEGQWELTIHADDGTVVLELDRQARIEPEGRVEVSWGRTLPSGQPAPPGTYTARSTFTTEDGQEHELRSAAFELRNGRNPDLPENDQSPTIDVREPEQDATVDPGPVRVRVRLADDHALRAYNLTMDGRMLAYDGNLDRPNVELDRTARLEPGRHVLLVRAFDHTGHEALERVEFEVANQTDAELTVRTDRGQYGHGDAVRIIVKNTGDEPLTGTPSLQVSTEDGRAVWSPQFAQMVQTLEPGQERVYPWNQRNDQGERVPAGTYVATATWGPQAEGDSTDLRIGDRGADFSIKVVEPRPGSVQDGPVTLAIEVGEPGATALSIRVADGAAGLDRQQHFEEPVTGTVERTVDLAGSPEGTYEVSIRAEGPGGVAQARTWFRLAGTADQEEPTLTVHEPRDGAEVGRLAAVVFEARDDVGIRYAEAYVGDELVGRHAWPQPVDRGAFPVRLSSDQVGEQRLRVVVYDAGNHRTFQDLTLQVRQGPAGPCSEVLARAQAAMAQTSPNATPAALNASLEAGLEVDCPAREDLPKQAKGRFAFAQGPGGEVRDVALRSKALFDRIAGAEEADDRRRGLQVQTRGQFLVVEAGDDGNLTYDLNGTWVALQKGRHVMLENTEDGSRALVVLPGGARPDILGRRVVTSLPPGAQAVVRPLGQSPVEDQVAQGIVEGRIGAEVSVSTGNETPEAVSYSDLNVTVDRSHGRVQATLATPPGEHAGRTLVFTLADGAVAGQQLEVLLDGEPVVRAASLADVLDTPDPDAPSEYYVVQDGEETKLLLQVNHFSTREVVIQAAVVAELFLHPVAVLGGLVVVGAAAVALFRRDDGL